MKPSLRCQRYGFSLLELILVVSIVGLVVSLLMPAVQRARESAARTGCLANLKQIGIALHQFHDTQGSFPQSSKELVLPELPQNAGVTWMVQILPFIEQEPLWNTTLAAFQQDYLPYDNPPHVGLATVISQYACPSDPRLLEPLKDKNAIVSTRTSYLGVAGGTSDDGIILPTRGVAMAEITDGLTNTLMVGERPPPLSLQAGWWYSNAYDFSWWGNAVGPDLTALIRRDVPVPIDDSGCTGPFFYGPGTLENQCDRWHFWSLHPNGANFLFADGAARFISYSAEPIMVALATRARGEIVAIPDY